MDEKNKYPEVLTTQEAADFLRVKDKRTILRLIHENELNAKKVGKGYRILKSELVKYLTEE